MLIKLVSLADGPLGNKRELAKAELTYQLDIAASVSEDTKLHCHLDIAKRILEGAELRKSDRGWKGGKKRYKEDGKQIKSGIASTFAFVVAIALPCCWKVRCSVSITGLASATHISVSSHRIVTFAPYAIHYHLHASLRPDCPSYFILRISYFAIRILHFISPIFIILIAALVFRFFHSPTPWISCIDWGSSWQFPIFSKQAWSSIVGPAIASKKGGH